MNIQYMYDRKTNFVHYIVKGVFAVDDISSKIMEVMEQVDPERQYYDLWDIRGVELLDNASDLIWAMAEATRQRASTRKRPRGKTALVADANHLYGLGRMYEQLLHDNVHWEHQVFSGIDQAMTWLRG